MQLWRTDGPRGALLNYVVKTYANSKWDSMGMVIRDERGRLHMLIATLNGVQLLPVGHGDDAGGRALLDSKVAFMSTTPCETPFLLGL